MNDTHDPAAHACLRFGWSAVAGFLAMGLVLEALHLIKAPFYLDLHLRRELWTLAHAHGTLLGLVTVAFANGVGYLPLPASRRRAALYVRLGALLVPLGFLLGGLGSSETDPLPAIILVPIGAGLVLLGLAPLVARLWRGSPSPPDPDTYAAKSGKPKRGK